MFKGPGEEGTWVPRGVPLRLVPIIRTFIQTIAVDYKIIMIIGLQSVASHAWWPHSASYRGPADF